MSQSSLSVSTDRAAPVAVGRPSAYVLIGIPGSGKTTWAAENLPEVAVACADKTLLRLAERDGVPYEKVLGKVNFARALKEFQRTVANAILRGNDVVLDQINHTREARARKLAAIPAGYRRVGVYFPISIEEALERTRKRELDEGPYSRRVPETVIRQIAAQFEAPEAAEFDEIILVQPKPANGPSSLTM